MIPIADPEKWAKVKTDEEAQFRLHLGDELWKRICAEVERRTHLTRHSTGPHKDAAG